MEQTSVSGSGMNIQDNFSEGLETVFRVKNTSIFDAVADPGFEIFLIMDPGSGKNIPDPQHCKQDEACFKR